MIDLTGVSKVYPVKNGGQVVALDGVNLHVDRGSIHGIVGRSGAGKSTLIRCLTALEKPTEGSIVVDGLDLSTLSGSQLRAARRHIGMVFQAANLLDARTAADNIGYPLKLAGVPANKRRARVDELLELVGLGRTRATPIPPSFPVVSASAWVLPEPWLTTLASFYVMSPRVPSTPSPLRRFCRCCAASVTSRVLPSSSSPMRCLSSAKSVTS